MPSSTRRPRSDVEHEAEEHAAAREISRPASREPIVVDKANPRSAPSQLPVDARAGLECESRRQHGGCFRPAEHLRERTKARNRVVSLYQRRARVPVVMRGPTRTAPTWLIVATPLLVVNHELL